MTDSGPQRCRRCILPENYPGIVLDEQGVCGPCLRTSSPERDWDAREKLRRRLDELVASIKGRDRYDVLVAYSGGKDSSFTLDWLIREYGLSVLAVTLDNGFLYPGALANIERLVRSLGVDHAIVRPPEEMTRKLFAAAAERDIFSPSTLGRASAICTACISLVKFVCLRRAIEDRIPLVAYGWTPGQAPLSAALRRPAPAMLRQMQSVLHDPIREVVGTDADEYFLSEEHFADAEAIPHLVSPLELADYDERRILERLAELGWTRPDANDPHTTNCELNALASQVHRARHGYHPYAFELAGLVRAGKLTREEALARVEAPSASEAVAAAARKLGLKGW